MPSCTSNINGQFLEKSFKSSNSLNFTNHFGNHCFFMLKITSGVKSFFYIEIYIIKVLPLGIQLL